KKNDVNAFVGHRVYARELRGPPVSMHMSLPGIGPASCVEPTNRLRTRKSTRAKRLFQLMVICVQFIPVWLCGAFHTGRHEKC
ncbi:MAG TPA: hypothetical protein VM141_01420, partial [Planctomycetota bacterium]|nr:hypothetical protein [Planctomycetota bacterium]